MALDTKRTKGLITSEGFIGKTRGWLRNFINSDFFGFKSDDARFPFEYFKNKRLNGKRDGIGCEGLDRKDQNAFVLEAEGYTVFYGEIPDGLFLAKELPQNDFFVFTKQVQQKYRLSFIPSVNPPKKQKIEQEKNSDGHKNP